MIIKNEFYEKDRIMKSSESNLFLRVYDQDSTFYSQTFVIKDFIYDDIMKQDIKEMNKTLEPILDN